MQLIITLVAGLLTIGAMSGQQALPAGHYEGVLKAPNAEMTIALDLEKNTKQVWIGSFDINMPNAPKGVPLEKLTVDGDNVSWEMSGGAFKAKFSAEQKTLNGSASGSGGEVPFEMKRTGDAKVNLPPPSTPMTKDFIGAWEGTVEMQPGQPLRLLATFASDADGKGTGEIVSIDQGGVKIPISTVTQSGSKLNFEIRSVGGTYAGTLNEAKTEIAGEWSQAGRTAPLNFKKQKAPEPK
jgi:uncharacterized protein